MEYKSELKGAKTTSNDVSFFVLSFFPMSLDDEIYKG